MSDGLYEPVTRQKTYQLVADRLLRLIGTQELGPGDPIPSERELGRLYRVGRSSIREALRMLESKAIIRSEPNGGFVVAEFAGTLNDSFDVLLSVADLRELFEVRHMIEGEASALAAARRHESDIGRIAREIGAMEAGLGSERAFITADLRFHEAIAQASQNRLIVHLMAAMRTQLERSLASSVRVPGAPEHAIEMHRRILEAIEARDPGEARRRMHEHVSRVERR